MILDWTCTSVCRPGIFRDTLESFRENLHGVCLADSTLYLNVDPVPHEVPVQSVIDVAQEFFGDVITRTPPEPCFPAAVKWCWQQPRTEYFFHTEDDWRVDRDVDVADLLELLQSDPALACVNLRAYSHCDDRICLAPGLWRSVAARGIAAGMRTDANPERQLRKAGEDNPTGGLHGGWKGVQYPADSTKHVIRDIGRLHLVTIGYRREGGKRFTRWARVESEAPAKCNRQAVCQRI